MKMEKQFVLNEINLTPLRESIAESIRESIINGKIKPGERLLEPNVAKLLGVSRTPVREAFFQLESEGLVEVMPRKGAIVSEISIKDALELYSVRSVLEGLAVKNATQNITPEKIEELKNVNEILIKHAKKESDNFREITALNNQFHDLINREAKNEKLYQTIELLHKQTMRYNYIYLSVMFRLKVSIGEHEEIIKLISEKKSDEAEKLMRKHVEDAGKQLCEYIKSGITKQPM
jgi:DNA-binding GntR family transcriptional regulator